MAMAKKKIILPFVVAPRREPIVEMIGSEESGKFEIKRLGYLTVSEKTFMQQAMSGDQSMVILQRLALKVSKEQGIQMQEVVELLSSGDFQDKRLVGHEEEISEVISTMSTFENRRKIIAVTCLILFRISESWGIEQTMDLHPDILDGLYELFTEEDARSLEAFEKEKEDDAPGGK
tara:strand:- start:1106 stop:1633 length:528 start_codon:yes stop_codon:yes gene_type:complete